MPFEISIIAPLYNEEKVYPTLMERLNELLNSSKIKIEVVLIDDGSKDQTSILMHQTALSDERYQCVFLSRNFGHQAALTAGLQYANATDAVLIIDGDLQDPPELLPQFYQKLKEGYDVVYGKRKKRKERFFKKLLANLFYRILKMISDTDIPKDTGDFALISRRVVDILNQMPEENRYLRGMRSWTGFNQVGLEYDRPEREAGKASYTFKQSKKLALAGIFNFSEIPIKFITKLGVLAISLGLIYFAHVLYKKIFLDAVVEGFTGLLFSIVFFSGVQLISIGIIGEYVLRIYFQVKKRPLFIIKNRIVNKNIL